MEVRAGYKNTEIGVIPKDWEIKELGEIGENIIGLTYSPNDVRDYGSLVLRSSNIQNNKLAFENNVFVEMDLPQRVIVRKNDILICVRNGSKHLIGKCALIDKQTEGCAFGAFMSVYRTQYANYIFHQFQSNIIQNQIDEVMGATINQLTNKDLATFQIPIPPTLAEQTAIATALSDADAYIAGLEKLIAKKRNIKQGAMQELLKPKKGWAFEPIKNIASISTGAKNTQDKVDDGIYPFFVRSPNIENINSFSFDGEAVLVAGDGVGTGKVMHYYNGKFDFHQRVYKISDFQNNINGLYFFLYFKENFYNRIMQMTAKSSVDSIRREMISEMIISFPSIEEQTSIATIFGDMDKEIVLLEKKLEKARSIKQGMMQQLLTGKIRLV